MKSIVCFSFICLVWVGLAAAAISQSSLSPRARLSPQEVADSLRSSQFHSMFVVGHRAGGVGASENSLDAVLNSIQAGVPVIEIDVRPSKDGEVFLLHNHKLNKMTNGRGPIELKTSRELERLRLPDGQKLPTFREVYEKTRGKAMMVIHFKDNVVAPVARQIEERGSFDDAIFFLSTVDQIAAAAPFKARHPEMLIMVKLKSVEELQQFEWMYRFRPSVIEVVPFNPDTVRQFHALGFKIYGKSGGVEKVSKSQRAEAIKKLKDKKIDLVLIDQPLLIMD